MAKPATWQMSQEHVRLERAIERQRYYVYLSTGARLGEVRATRPGGYWQVTAWNGAWWGTFERRRDAVQVLIDRYNNGSYTKHEGDN